MSRRERQDFHHQKDTKRRKRSSEPALNALVFVFFVVAGLPFFGQPDQSSLFPGALQWQRCFERPSSRV
jgi:hypothetical protein